ncbi:MAG TPA: hypothetical protein VJN62_06130 [Gemmatimonadales bacterium]|nr:hypothetical protein [Gemmatimonadales bacterium]
MRPVAVPKRFAALTRGLLSSRKGIVVAPGFGSNHAVLKIRGKVFAIFMPDQIVVKLPQDRVEAMCQKPGFAQFDPRKNGQLMKEWLIVPGSDRRRVALAREALEFVAKPRSS